MTVPLPSFLAELEAAADASARAEDEFRRGVAARFKALETERAFAFRRLNLMRALVQAMAAAEDEEAAVTYARAALRARLGWASDSKARLEVVARFEPVARAMFAPCEPAEGDAESSAGARPSAKEALAAFESWYVATHPVPFWVLFENVMPETPVVDF